jgi:dTDP-4-amino-4,6-dideoxygalactose transaminase
MVPSAFPEPVYVTRPITPPLPAYVAMLETIWDRRRFTNGGEFSEALEAALRSYLGVPQLTLTNNGTTALLIAARALEFSGEVITTPFTFPATLHALKWCDVEPVFADIDPRRLTLSPEAVERAITARTSAILGVHVYGAPCDVEALQTIADRHGLRILYDGAHAFGVEIDGRPVANYGDATAFSFHATKLFHTAEGGALATRDAELARKFGLMRNFGIVDESTVLETGINGKLSELQAALGLSLLGMIDQERERRRAIAEVYRSRLGEIEGISFHSSPERVTTSDQYFVIRIDRDQAALSRDQLYESLKPFNVYARRYFYPLCSAFSPYDRLPSSRPENLTVAHRAAEEVLCLPFFGDLATDGAHQICDIIEYLFRSRGVS